ncbi:FeoA family protein [Martelella sp. HB161492]|uniref:FeoA family protein n=1 Tax=Martelella sp. HB161492 TaxID=2720726 RepID=UPI001AED99F7|nr:FeoA family protein [Martelella sp. HB161492]
MLNNPAMATALEGRIISLDMLEPGESGIVEIVDSGACEIGLSNRLKALGLSATHEVSMLRRGWFGGPLVVRAGRTTEIAIRRSEAALVRVRRSEK